MKRARSSLGFFGVFGRSGDLRQLDGALRAAGVHPALVPEGVKLAAVNLMKDEHGGAMPPAEAYAPAARLLAYCILGAEQFEGIEGGDARMAVERRIETASDAGEGLDASLVLLLVHAKLIRPEVVAAFDLRAEE
jgi:hypothetical protein